MKFEVDLDLKEAMSVDTGGSAVLDDEDQIINEHEKVMVDEDDDAVVVMTFVREE